MYIEENLVGDVDEIGIKIHQPRNNEASNIQITAEQIIRESHGHRTDEIKIPTEFITGKEELEEFKQIKRKEFEDQIRRQKHNISLYIKYAEWEKHQLENERVRSIFERAIEINYKNVYNK